jgi:hypothetical protein
MKNRLAQMVGVAALVFEAALMFGCSSSSKGGSAGDASAATTGSGGATGTGPATGTGGATEAASDAGAATPKYAAACVGVSSKAACDMATSTPCANTCGPNKTGYKNCDCVAGQWSCPVCAYQSGVDFSCYKVTDATLLCPNDPTDLSGMGLLLSGSSCTQPDCTPCGSKVQNAYRDTGGSPKQGFCVCVHADPTMPGKYSCTSIKEYPPAALQ